MALRLGGQLELKDVDVRTSTNEARKLFFSLIMEMKPEVVQDLFRLFNVRKLSPEHRSLNFELLHHPSLFTPPVKFFLLHTKNHDYYNYDVTKLHWDSKVRDTPVLAYFDFLFKNKDEFNKILEKYSSCEIPALRTTYAVKEMIPDWASLQRRKDSKWLCDELRNWGKRWYLLDDWIMDFALEGLMHFKIDLIDKYDFPDDYLKSRKYTSFIDLYNYWFRGAAWRASLFRWDFECRDISAPMKMEDYPEFTFTWSPTRESQNGEVRTEGFRFRSSYNPLSYSASEFRKNVESIFWTKFFDFYSGLRTEIALPTKAISSELSRFLSSLEEYIAECHSTLEPFTRNTPVKREDDKHFRWLIEYQIEGPNRKSFEDIAKLSNVDKSAVRHGIKSVRKLLNLKLRRATRPGRTKGIRENHVRHRVG